MLEKRYIMLEFCQDLADSRYCGLWPQKPYFWLATWWCDGIWIPLVCLPLRIENKITCWVAKIGFGQLSCHLLISLSDP